MGQILLSVPPSLAAFLRSPAGRRRWSRRFADWTGEPVFVGHDPLARRLGSGGGTVNLLAEAWRKECPRGRPALGEWLRRGQRTILHAGGESRRLPAYASIGKAFMPIPQIEGLEPRRLDQMLADFQVPAYRQVLREAGTKAAVLISSGDVWLDFNPLEVPAIGADIAGIGMRVTPEVAAHFGTFFTERGRDPGKGERTIRFFLQKPASSEIYRHNARYDCFVDTGLWLLSAEAVEMLFRRCRWDDRKGRFRTADGFPAFLDLYTEIGSALGTETRAPAALKRVGWDRLTASVIPLEEARFHHLGSNRQLFESFDALQRGRLIPERTLCAGTPPAAVVASGPVWADGVRSWPLQAAGHNLIVGLPEGARIKRFQAGWCLETAPALGGGWIFRPFHVDDTLRGAPGAGGRICGVDAAAWLEARPELWSAKGSVRGERPNRPQFIRATSPVAPPGFKLSFGTAVSLQRAGRGGASPGGADVFQQMIYPIVSAEAIDQESLEWFFSPRPDPEVGAKIAACARVSASLIPMVVDYARLFAERSAATTSVLQAEFAACAEGDDRVFAQDFAAIAQHCQAHAPKFGAWLTREAPRLLERIGRAEHASRLLMLLSELSSGGAPSRRRDEAYARLRASVVETNPWEKSQPRATLKEDQIVWARSPVRLDFAGGWTDTPPYCFERGGSVVNAAVLLNGQPPIQVFVRPVAEPLFRLRSIDLGSSDEIRTFAELESFRDPRSGFSLPKAALTLAGFHPDFHAERAFPTLRRHLESLGGGLEISLLSAVPKGSGLGTSSILGATVLGALNRACGLGWDEVDLYQRVLGVEQLLTTGGGWQDQAGALYRSVKLIQTGPGLAQRPTVRFLPEHLLGPGEANQTMLLYYTGLTRLAKGILKDIVRDMFLGRSSTVRTLSAIRTNAERLYEAMQGSDRAEMHRCIARSWELNCRLDPGTSSPEIARIIAQAGPEVTGCKLLGAGGGGYMILCAATPEAGQRVRARLESRPPNARARFIDFALSDRALEVTVS